MRYAVVLWLVACTLEPVESGEGIPGCVEDEGVILVEMLHECFSCLEVEAWSCTASVAGQQLLLDPHVRVTNIPRRTCSKECHTAFVECDVGDLDLTGVTEVVVGGRTEGLFVCNPS